MPVMDGHEAIRRIRSMDGGKIPKIIAVTASAMDENRQRADGNRRRRFHQQAVPGSRAIPEDSRPRGRGVRSTPSNPQTASPRRTGRGHARVARDALPRDLIDQMREAVIGADLDQLLATIREVEARDPKPLRGCGAWPKISNTRSFSIYSVQHTAGISMQPWRSLIRVADRQACSVSADRRRPGKVRTGSRRPSILVVDDVSANLQVLTGMLKDRGYKVRPVPSGKLALAGGPEGPARPDPARHQHAGDERL